MQWEGAAIDTAMSTFEHCSLQAAVQLPQSRVLVAVFHLISLTLLPPLYCGNI